MLLTGCVTDCNITPSAISDNKVGGAQINLDCKTE